MEGNGIERIRENYHTISSVSYRICWTYSVWALLLTLPQATQDRLGLTFLNAAFTATSAVCVTGLVVVDTATTFTLFDLFGNFSSMTTFVGDPIVNITIMLLIICGKIGL